MFDESRQVELPGQLEEVRLGLDRGQGRGHGQEGHQETGRGGVEGHLSLRLDNSLSSELRNRERRDERDPSCEKHDFQVSEETGFGNQRRDRELRCYPCSP